MEHELLLLKQNRFAVDILEESVIQASKALTEDRNRYLATITFDSIECNEQEHNFKKLVLYTLAELTDFEVQLLANCHYNSFTRVFRELEPNLVTIGQYNNFSKEEQDAYEDKKAAFKATKQKFERLNLIESQTNDTFHEPSVRDISDLHRLLKKAIRKENKYELSDFGKALLRAIGFIDKN
jgi:hypothetical protein